MKSFILSAILFWTFAFAMSGPSIKGRVVIGDNLYFTDSIFRSQEQALNFCNSQGAELAKVTNYALYNQIRLAIPNNSTYWIDGIDKEHEDRFALNNDCTSGELDFSDFPENNLYLPAKTCLALVNGLSDSDSRIEAIECIIPYQVLCSIPQQWKNVRCPGQ